MINIDGPVSSAGDTTDGDRILDIDGPVLSAEHQLLIQLQHIHQLQILLRNHYQMET